MVERIESLATTIADMEQTRQQEREDLLLQLANADEQLKEHVSQKAKVCRGDKSLIFGW